MSLWLMENDPSDRRRSHRFRRAVYRRVSGSRLLAVFARLRFGIARLWLLWMVATTSAVGMVAALDAADLLTVHIPPDQLTTLLVHLVIRPLPIIVLSIVVASLGVLSDWSRDWYDDGHRAPLVERLIGRMP